MSSLSLLDIKLARLEIARMQDKNLFPISKKMIDLLSQFTEAEKISIILKNQNNQFIIFNSLNIPSDLQENIIIDVDNSFILSRVRRDKKTIFCKNILLDPNFGIQKRFRYNSLSFISTPIFDDNNVIGFISLSNFSKTIQSLHKNFLEEVTEEFATIIKKKNKIQNKEQNLELKTKSIKSIKNGLKENNIENSLYFSENKDQDKYIEINHIKNTNDNIFLYLFSSDDEFIFEKNNIIWSIATVKLLIEINHHLLSFFTQFNHFFFNMLKRTSKDFHLLGLSIDQKNKAIEYVNCDHSFSLLYKISENKIVLLNKKSTHLISDQFKIKSYKEKYKDQFILIIFSHAFLLHFKDTKQLYRTLERILNKYNNRSTAFIMSEMEKNINIDKTRNCSIMILKSQ